jgi:hypothetical protein
MSKLSHTPFAASIMPHRTFAATLIRAGALLGALVAVDAASAQQRMQGPGPMRSSTQVEVAAVEVSRTPYQAYLAADCLGGGSNFCRFESEGVPRWRRLELHRVSCQGWHASDTPPNFVVIANLETAAGTLVRRIDLLETRYTRVNTNSVWMISEQVLMFIPAGHRLEIAVNSASTGIGSYGCTISGYLVALGPAS